MVQRERHRRVPSAHRDFFDVGPGVHPQSYESMPQLVHLEALEPGRAHRRMPPATAESRAPQSRALRPGEHQCVRAGADEAPEVSL